MDTEAEQRKPQTSPLDVQGKEFQHWHKAQNKSQSLGRKISAALTNHLPKGGGTGDPGNGNGGSRPPPPPHKAFYAYVNSRPNLDWNTCGQAAIASIADYHDRDPYGLPRNSSARWSDGAIIDAIIEGGFGPDVVFGLGTTAGRIRDALASYGLAVTAGSSGPFFDGWQTQWNTLLQNVYYFGQPTPVLVDLGSLGGPALTAHWPVVYRMEYTSTGMLLDLGNCEWAPQVKEDRFLDAWACRQLPLGFNHCGVYCTSYP